MPMVRVSNGGTTDAYTISKSSTDVSGARLAIGNGDTVSFPQIESLSNTSFENLFKITYGQNLTITALKALKIKGKHVKNDGTTVLQTIDTTLSAGQSVTVPSVGYSAGYQCYYWNFMSFIIQ